LYFVLDKLNITSSKGKRPEKLNDKDLRKLILEAIQKGPWIGYSESIHARFDHPERHIDINDVLYGLEREWSGVKVVEFNADEWQWKYEIATEDIEGEPLTILIAVDPRNRSFEVVTRW
jgi:hypothetical protein